MHGCYNKAACPYFKTLVHYTCNTFITHLMENRSDTARDRRNYPHPVSGTASSSLRLCLHVCHEPFTGRVVVRDREVSFLYNEV